jgi:hypothetical protein
VKARTARQHLLKSLRAAPCSSSPAHTRNSVSPQHQLYNHTPHLSHPSPLTVHIAHLHTMARLKEGGEYERTHHESPNALPGSRKGPRGVSWKFLNAVTRQKGRPPVTIRANVKIEVVLALWQAQDRLILELGRRRRRAMLRTQPSSQQLLDPIRDGRNCLSSDRTQRQQQVMPSTTSQQAMPTTILEQVPPTSLLEQATRLGRVGQSPATAVRKPVRKATTSPENMAMAVEEA